MIGPSKERSEPLSLERTLCWTDGIRFPTPRGDPWSAPVNNFPAQWITVPALLALRCNKPIANIPVTRNNCPRHPMVTLQFTYHEIMDTDWTAIDLAVLENGQPLAVFRNYDREELVKEIYGNQTETFLLPDLTTALRMIASNGAFVKCPVDIASIDRT
jgi:hypothetical protein